MLIPLLVLVTVSTSLAVDCPNGYSSCSENLCIPNNSKLCVPYLDPRFTFEERAADLVSRMTIAQKIQQLQHDAPAIPELEVPHYRWDTECLHGYVNYPPQEGVGYATVFPQSLAIASSWNVKNLRTVGKITALEGRALHNWYQSKGIVDCHTGLTCWAPNLNIARDPRWGRNQETYGEDPLLTARMTVEYVKHLQGNHPKYYELISTCKHYDAYSLENYQGVDRFSFNAIVNEADLKLTYLPAFKACVTEGNAHSVMCSFNELNGVPSCANSKFLKDILRGEWKFDGYVVGDCGAVEMIHNNHHYTKTMEEGVAAALINGTALDCGIGYGTYLQAALDQNLVTKYHIDDAVRQLMLARFKLGMFDSSTINDLKNIPINATNTEEHRELALAIARETIVLLKNNDILPLQPIGKIALIGPNANDEDVMYGSYQGINDNMVTPLKALRKYKNITVNYAQGCQDIWCKDETHFAEAITAVKNSDAVILTMGINLSVETEGTDREEITLPGRQEQLIHAVLDAAGTKPVVLVLITGSPVTLSKELLARINALVQSVYPGEEGGTAIMDVLFGVYNPAGRLPMTVVQSLDQLPPFKNMSMVGRTYRFSEYQPQFYFGDGLSFTKFNYSSLIISNEVGTCGVLKGTVIVSNIGKRAGDEVVQIYISNLSATVASPKRTLGAFERVHLAVGQSKVVSFVVNPQEMSVVLPNGDHVVQADSYEIAVGGHHPLSKATVSNVILHGFSVVGRTRILSSCY